MVQSSKLGLGILLLLLVLFSVNFSSAARVVSVNPDQGLQIFDPLVDDLAQNEDFFLEFHVLNSSNGVELNVSDIDFCKVDLYNNDGSHKIKELIADTNVASNHFNVTILAGNFSELQHMSWYIYCNASVFNVGGAIRHDFVVRPIGQQLNEPIADMFMIYMLSMSALFLLSLYGAVKIPFDNKRSDEGQIIGINFMKYVKVFCIMNMYIMLLFFTGTINSMFEFYLQYDNLSAFFSYAYAVLFALLVPMLIMSFVIIVFNLLDDKRINDGIKRMRDII